MARILVVDDDPYVRSICQRNLTRKGHEVIEAQDCRDALEAVRGNPPDIVLLDYMLPGQSGLECFAAMRATLGDACPPTVMITGQGSTHLAVEFMKVGGADFVEKPVTDFDILHLRIERAMATRRIEDSSRAEAVRREAAEESDRLKDVFLSFMARELGDPMQAAVNGATRLAEAARRGVPPDPDAVGSLCVRIMDVAKVVDDLIELAAQDGLPSLPLFRVSLREALAAVRPEAEAKALAKGLELRWLVPDLLPEVMAEPMKLADILRKLVDNAVAFTPSGLVEVRAASEEGEVVVSVRDQGPGIDPRDQERVFGRFEKLSPADATPGAGVGLFIARSLAARMNARLSLESSPGRGSVFFLGLRAASGQTAADSDTAR